MKRNLGNFHFDEHLQSGGSILVLQRHLESNYNKFARISRGTQSYKKYITLVEERGLCNESFYALQCAYIETWRLLGHNGNIKIYDIKDRFTFLQDFLDLYATLVQEDKKVAITSDAIQGCKQSISNQLHSLFSSLVPNRIILSGHERTAQTLWCQAKYHQDFRLDQAFFDAIEDASVSGCDTLQQYKLHYRDTAIDVSYNPYIGERKVGLIGLPMEILMLMNSELWNKPKTIQLEGLGSGKLFGYETDDELQQRVSMSLVDVLTPQQSTMLITHEQYIKACYQHFDIQAPAKITNGSIHLFAIDSNNTNHVMYSKTLK